MKKIFLVTMLILFSALTLAQNKSAYDLNSPRLEKNTVVSSFSDYRESVNESTAATLLNFGYYTIGTTAGLSKSKFDDNCAITFGHPLAKTSYPVFSIDGYWYKYEDYFIDGYNSSLQKNGDTLSVNYKKEGLVSVNFKIINEHGSGKILLIQEIENLDNAPHSFGLGFAFDPALGKWGDGCIAAQDGFVKTETVFDQNSFPSPLTIWEKTTGSKGIGIDIDFDSANPDKIIAANWADIYNDESPSAAIDETKELYDLYIKMFWNEETLQPREEKTCSSVVSLKEPDFSSSAFLRWNLPSFVSLNSGVYFPDEFNSLVEISSNEISGPGSLQISTPSVLTADNKKIELNINYGSATYQIIKLKPRIIYEDKVVDVAAKLMSNGSVVDEIHKKMLIPSTPVSDTGLVVIEDSLVTSSFPNVDLIFGTEEEATGRRIFNLTNDNIFLYENSKRIEDFNLEKYSGGNATTADIVFVLDVSGSMGDNIAAVRNNLNEFADSLMARGYDFKIGVVTFSTTVDHIWDLTNDVERIKQNLASISLWGGEENSLAALYKASELSFRPNSKRLIIWVTDEGYSFVSYNKQQVVDRMLQMDITVHGIGLNSLQTEWFNPIVQPTGGNFYDIEGNFRDILLDVSRLQANGLFKLSFTSNLATSAEKQFTLEIHYGGLGVIKNYGYSSNNLISNTPNKQLSFYPNPFNPEITFRVKPKNYSTGTLKIFNILGECVRTFRLNGNSPAKLTWNARNEVGEIVGSGFYIVRLELRDDKNQLYRETAKIVHIK